jgi:mannobiose 2-epimerase
MKNVFIFIAVLCLAASCAVKPSPEEQAMNQLKQEIVADLTDNILPFWASHSPDPAGGFYGTLLPDGTAKDNAEKGGILNARLLWTFSSAWRVLKDERYKTLADRAQRYFIDHFIDKEYGGSFYVLNADGSPLATQKNTYQNAFAIYGLSEHYRATGNEESLREAIGIYNKLVEHAFDPQHKGFIEECSREWTQDNERFVHSKTMNTNLHVLEAFTNLYRVWQDPGLYQQLKDEIDVASHKILDQTTWHEILYLSMDWTPAPVRIDSYGHDVEFSWLLVEAAEVLGDKAILEDTKRIAVNLAAVQIKEGLTPEGYIRGEKFHGELPPWQTEDALHRLEWWPQAEAVVGFVNAWQISGDKKYLDAAVLAWEWTKKYMIDHEYGEWYGNVLEDGSPVKTFEKASQWRCPYHNSRMGFEIIAR